MPDLAVGSCVTIYGRVIHLVDADAFTREFAAARWVGGWVIEGRWR